MHGRGLLSFGPSGDTLEGQFVAGVARGMCRLTTRLGVEIEGRFDGDRLEGSGCMRSTAGERYEGGIRVTLGDSGAVWTREGEGEMHSRQGGGESLLGTWVDNLLHGHGVRSMASGEVYAGEWCAGQPHGYGTLRAANLDEYEGEWRAGERFGEGTQRRSASNDVLVGKWISDEMTGHGQQLGASGESYEGNFAHSQRDGDGRCVYPNGSHFVGEWRGGLREGLGRLEHGDAYSQGTWLRGELDGAGTQHDAHGATYVGEFARGMRHGQGKLADGAGAEHSGLEFLALSREKFLRIRISRPVGRVPHCAAILSHR